MSFKKKDVEESIFIYSLNIIDKYDNTRFSLNYKHERERAERVRDGRLDFHNVMNKDLRGVSGNGYLKAIKTIGLKLQRIMDNNPNARTDPENGVRVLRELVSLLITMREKELRAVFSIPIIGYPIIKGEEYVKHELTVDCWKQFKGLLFESPNIWNLFGLLS